MTVAAVVIFGALWAWTLAASGAPWHAVTVFWLVVGAGITLWIRRDLQKDLATFDAMLNGIESALRTDMASVLDEKAVARLRASVGDPTDYRRGFFEPPEMG